MMADDGAFADDFTAWYSPLEVAPNQELRGLREKGVALLVKQTTAQDIDGLVRVAFQGKTSSDQLARIRQPFLQADNDFPLQGNDQELQLLSAATLTALFRQDSDVGALAALAVTSASFGGARSPGLHRDLAAIAEKAILRLSKEARRRPSQLGTGTPAFPKQSFEKAVEKVKSQPEPAGLAEAIGLLVDACKAAYDRSLAHVSKTTTSIHKLMSVQDEELDMLWWLIGSRSHGLDCPLSALNEAQRLLVVADELAGMTTCLPGPLSLPSLLLRSGVPESGECVVVKCVNDCDKDEWLCSLVDEQEPSPMLCPLHFAVQRRLETGPSDAWVKAWSSVTGIAENVKVPFLRLATLFYRERLVMRHQKSAA